MRSWAASEAHAVEPVAFTPLPDWRLPPPAGVRGRLAPSPTGRLHLGNAWAFLLAWLSIRARGGELLLRLEDIDPQRSRPEYVAALLEDLRWLGLDWDYGPGGLCGDMPSWPQAGMEGSFFHQSRRAAIYEAALAALEAGGMTYPCFCTRREVRQLAGAPHEDERCAPYPGTCRHLSDGERMARLSAGRRPCVRLRCPDSLWSFEDAVMGPQAARLDECGGDFALRRSDGVVAYQLATALDDGLMGITEVARGRDILPSTPRQLALLHLLGLPAPRYAHFPLLLDGEGERFAKRHRSLTLAALREQGVPPGCIIGLLGFWAGCLPHARSVHPRELVRAFSWSRVPREDIRVDACLLRENF